MKNNDKKVYTVHGSEDGLLGVYSNFKLAFERWAMYGKKPFLHCGTDKDYNPIKKTANYANVQREIKEHSVTTIDFEYGSVTIEQHFLNN